MSRSRACSGVPSTCTGRGQIPRFLWVSAQDSAWWQSAGLVGLVLLFFWGLYRLLRLAIAVAAREAVPYALRRPWVWVAPPRPWCW